MTAITLRQITRTYANNGQHAEQTARYTLTGRIERADNKPFTLGGDCGDIQIKSARATICHGTDIRAHIAMDGANRYGYVTADFATMYLMSADEYFEFATLFGTLTRESEKNGGATKIRLKAEGKAMTKWFSEKC